MDPQILRALTVIIKTSTKRLAQAVLFPKPLSLWANVFATARESERTIRVGRKFFHPKMAQSISPHISLAKLHEATSGQRTTMLLSVQVDRVMPATSCFIFPLNSSLPTSYSTLLWLVSSHYNVSTVRTVNFYLQILDQRFLITICWECRKWWAYKRN